MSSLPIDVTGCRDTLYIAPSTIHGAGNGLFTSRPIKKHEFIGFYRGKQMTVSEANDYYARYIIVPDGACDDSCIACLPPCAMALVNEAPTNCEQNSFQLSLHRRDLNDESSAQNEAAVALFACKNIRSHSEILCHYGPHYNRTYKVGRPYVIRQTSLRSVAKLQHPHEVLMDHQPNPPDAFLSCEEK